MENMTDFGKEEMEQKIRFLLDGVKLAKTYNMYPHELSGGMQRRVGIARALCTEPVVAIFDEPTSGLDPVTSTIILNMIDDLVGTDEGQTSLVVTTNVEIGIRYADRVIMVNDGKVAADGPWRELLLDGPEWVRNFLAVRLIGLDLAYAQELDLPGKFIDQHW
jgi:ABC-type transporter Mla maintaining outer membrane lipid asymmetry ATPase subunit MlaF